MSVWGVLAGVTAVSACASSTGDSKTPSGGATGQAGAQGGSGAQAGAAGQGAQAGAASSDPCTTALFCDDFEADATGTPPPAPWSNNMNGGTVAVDATHARSGAHAVKFSGAAATGYRSAMMILQHTSFLPTPGNVIYGRMMFWLDSAPTASVHWTFIQGEGLIPGQNYHAQYRYGGQLPISNGGTFEGSQFLANYDTPDSYASPAVGPSSDCWNHADMKVVPVGAWSCAEWKFDGAANKMQFWLDGQEITSLAVNGTGQGCVNQPATFPWTAPTFDRIDLGWESYQADDARTLWIDDVAISTQKVGCPQ